MKRTINHYFIRQLWLVILCLLPLLQSNAQQPTYIKNNIKYTDVAFAVYFAHCDPNQMSYTVNGVPFTPTIVFASGGFIANRIPFGLFKVGDNLKVTNTCDGSSVSRIIQDDYAYVEIPNGTSYTGNGISPSDTDPPYARLQTPVLLGKCEVVSNVNAHILDNYYFSMNDPITYGVFKHNGLPIVAGDYSNDHYGQSGVVWNVNADGSVYTNNSTTLTSYQAYSGASPQTISYTHNGATIQSDLTLNFGGLSIRYIRNGSYSIEKNTYNGLQRTDFTGNFSNSTFEIRYTSSTIEAWVDGVKIDELQRDVQYSVSGGGTISNTGGLPYGTSVNFSPTSAGDYVISAVINGVRRAEQKIHITGEPTMNAVVNNPTCPNELGSITANGSGFGALQYAINGSAWGSSNTFTNLSPGVYTISVKDASGCITNSDQTIVVQNTLPVLSVSGTACSADLRTYSVTFASNGSSVSSTAGTVSGNVVAGIPTGTNVTLTATSSAGCQTTLAVTAPTCACPNVNAPNSGGDRSFCVGNAIPAVSANAGVNETVDWYDAAMGGNLLSSSTTLYQATQAGTYYAEARNTITGCKSATRTAVTVSQNALPTLSTSSVTCSADLRTYAITFVSDGNVVVSANTGVTSMSTIIRIERYRMLTKC